MPSTVKTAPSPETPHKADLQKVDLQKFPSALRRQFRDLLFGSASLSEIEGLSEADLDRAADFAFRSFAVRLPGTHNVQVGSGEGEVGNRHMPVALSTDDMPFLVDSTSQIVASQQGRWYVFLLLPSFLIYVISMVGETNRAPFDLPEAEGELVGGFHTEYSSLKFAMFMLAEYVNMTTVSALAATMFLGGWQAPLPFSLIDGANSGWWPLLWFVAKVWGFLFLFMWLRATLPRMRYDQFMTLGWKVLIPLSLAWIVVVSVTKTLRNQGAPAWTTAAVSGAAIAVLAVVVIIRRAVRRHAIPHFTLPTDPEAVRSFPIPPIPSPLRTQPKEYSDVQGR